MAMELAAAKTVTGPEAKPGDPVYLKIRDLIYSTSGIYYSEDKLYLFVARCARRMLALGTSTASEYLDKLTVLGERNAELRLLLNEITIGETYMFRHPAQLDALRNVILPQILKAREAGAPKRLRFWCAGCSTGEEPHTLAMFLLELKDRMLAGYSFDILATDLNDNSLAAARAGIYGEYALRSTSDALRAKYFKDAGGKKLQANDLLKSQIHFDRLNLSDDSRMTAQRGIDVIFCCNVLIYFDKASKNRVVQNFHASLSSGGYLFLGHAESLFNVNDSFHLVHFPGTTAYWKPPSAAVAGGKK